LNSDKDFSVFRRFGQLHARILLYKQDELVELEENLNRLDIQETTPYNLKSRRTDQNPARKALLKEIENKLMEYDTVLEAYYNGLERSPPKERNIESVTHWFEGNKPVAMAESTFLNNRADLTAPAESDDHGMESFVTKSAEFLHIQKHLTSKEDALKSTDSHISFFTPSRVWKISRFLTTIFAIFVLTVPVVALYYIETISSRLWAIIAFTTLFSSLLSLSTRSRNYEIFSATAAYCAVLVVFVGNIPN